MPKAPPPPNARSLTWRKVHARLAALGMTPAQLAPKVFDDFDTSQERARHCVVTLSRWLERPSMLTVDRRLRLEAALHLPPGSLCDDVPLRVVSMAPVPPEYLPERPQAGPAADDIAADGEHARIAVGLRTIDAFLEPVSGMFASQLPPAGPAASAIA